MKSLISVTPREFKRHFGEVMDMCTDVCMTINQEIVITIPEKKNGETHIEIAKRSKKLLRNCKMHWLLLQKKSIE